MNWLKFLSKPDRIAHMSIYQQLPQPFFALAPMDDVTDTVFRRIIAQAGKPDLFYTEFVNADGFCSKGRDHVGLRLYFTPTETPLVAQIWGLNPDNFYTITREIKKLGFAGVDINMGCPQKKVVKRGACAAMINNQELATKVITAVKKAAGRDLPVSVKTRLGYKEIVTEEWIGFLLSFELDALTIHLRTAAQMSKVPAQYEELIKIMALRDKISPKTKIIANGDILTREQGENIVKKYGVDGIMIGRGIFHNPYLFAEPAKNGSREELLGLLLDHINLHEQTWNKKVKTYQPLKRFFKIYVNGFDGAAGLREKLMLTKNHQEARGLLTNTI